MPLTINHVLTATTPDSTQEIRPSHWNSAHAVSISLAGSEVLKWVSAGASSQSSGTIGFNNANGISFGLNNGTITASHNALTIQSNAGVSAQGGSSTFQTLVFSNQNNVSFSNSNGSIVGSASFAQSNQLLSVFGSSQTTGQSSSSTIDARSLSYRGAGIVSVGLSAGEMVISATVGSSLTAINMSAGTTSNNLSAAVFSNANNVSFGLNGSTVTASASFAQTNQQLGVFAVSNTTQSSSGTIDARSLTFAGAGVASVGVSNGSVIISVPSGGGAGDGGVGISAGVSSVSSGNVVFSNSNGVSFGLNGSTLTASYTVPSTIGHISAVNLSAGTTSNNLSAFTFSDLNGISFGLNGSVVTGSHNAITSQSNQAFSASGGSSAFQTLAFVNGNGATFTNNAGSVGLSYTVPTQSAQSVGVYALSNTTGAASSSTVDARSISFQGAGIASVGLSNGSVVISVPSGGGAGDGVNIIAAGTQTAATTGTVSFANSNGISFGMSNSSVVTASYTVPSTVGLISAINLSAGTTSGNLSAVTFSNAGNVSFGLNAGTVTATATFAQTNQSIGFYASSQTVGQSSSSTVDARSISVVGQGIVSAGMSAGSLLISATQSNQAASASNGSFTFQTLNFSNANGVTFGSSAGGIISASIATSLTNINVSGGTTSNNLSALVFSNSNGISFGLNGSTLTASVGAGGAAGSISAGTTSMALGQAVFSNSNGVSFGLNVSTLTASVAAQTNQSIGIYAVSNTTGASSSSTVDARSLSFQGKGIISVGLTNGTVVISTPDPTVFTQLSVGNSNLGNTAGDTGVFTGRMVLVGSNNITLSGSSNADSVTISIIGGAGGGGVAISGGTQSVSTGTMVFSNSNNVSFGMSGSSRMTASYAFNLSAGTTSNNLNAVTFSNANGVSFGLNASVVTASVAAQTNQTVGGYVVGNTTGQSSSTTFDARSMSIQGTGGVSVGYSAGTLVISGGAGGAGAAISAAGSSQNAGTIVFSNSNGVSFGMNGSTITATVTPGAAAGIAQMNNSNATYTSGTVQLTEGGGAITIASNTGQRFAFSVPQTSSLVGTNGISVSTNGSTVSVGQAALTQFVPFFQGSSQSQTFGAQGVTSASAFFAPFSLTAPVSFNQLEVAVRLSYATSTSAGSQSISSSWGLYSNNAGTLSQISSGSMSFAVSNSSVSATLSYGSSTNSAGYTYGTTTATATAQIHSLFGTAGNREMGLVFGNTISLSPGMYWFGIGHRHSSSNANVGISEGYIGNIWDAAQNIAPIGVATSAATGSTSIRSPYFGLAVGTVTMTQLPATVALSAMAHTVSVMPLVTLNST